VSFRPGNQLDWEEYPCSYGMVVETSWYNFSTPELYGYEVLPKKLQRGVPFVLDFAILNGSCPAKGQQPPPGYACASSNSFCTNTNTTGYVCHCIQGYEGNPYITNGCQGTYIYSQYACTCSTPSIKSVLLDASQLVIQNAIEPQKQPSGDNQARNHNSIASLDPTLN
jgi:hypothetical protein